MSLERTQNSTMKWPDEILDMIMEYVHQSIRPFLKRRICGDVNRDVVLSAIKRIDRCVVETFRKNQQLYHWTYPHLMKPYKRGLTISFLAHKYSLAYTTTYYSPLNTSTVELSPSEGYSTYAPAIPWAISRMWELMCAGREGPFTDDEIEFSIIF